MTAPSAGLSIVPALLGAAGLTAALGLVGELRGGWFGTAAFAAGCWALGSRSRLPAAPVIGLAAWLFHNGFAEHRYAELRWQGWGFETRQFAVFAGTALLAALTARLSRRP
ncbi:hypothetical protein [Kitasatospora cheerisanensis]|uniref:Uncharacterized protein n=1 Tax=Kitasatospora cheerisanensis KCTC 2395 TaxID=1348663 RepID=A0A066Z2J6_9ACTN|nr:hypothetical protein [Kitasatospora cheerisanensis]KDN84566.1 hypothetical protein KCH_36580 [Kitasatospora cheerisanensis KCTC 2395]